MATHEKMDSLSMPAIGVNKLKLSAKAVAKIMYDCVKNENISKGSLTDVKFVLYDKSTYKVNNSYYQLHSVLFIVSVQILD